MSIVSEAVKGFERITPPAWQEVNLNLYSGAKLAANLMLRRAEGPLDKLAFGLGFQKKEIGSLAISAGLTLGIGIIADTHGDDITVGATDIINETLDSVTPPYDLNIDELIRPFIPGK